MCRFRRDFEIPPASKVIKAFMRITADNSYTVYLDGRELGRGGDWGDLTEHDLTKLLEPGKHVLAVEAFNDFDAAGVLVGIHIEFADQSVTEIASDAAWKVVPLKESRWMEATLGSGNWAKARIVAPFRSQPWWWPQGPKIIRAPALPPLELHFWQSGWFQAIMLLLCVAFVILGLVCIRLMRRYRHRLAQLERQHALEIERTRIARDIHDQVGADLTELTVLGELAKRESLTPSQMRAQITNVADKTRELVKTMEEIVWAVNPRNDSAPNFASYLCSFSQEFLRHTSTRCRLDIMPAMPAIPFAAQMRHNLFLAVKEAIHNVVRHAEATELWLRIHLEGSNLIVLVEDNGRGCDPAQARRDGNGLRNMRERMEGIGGRLEIQPANGLGTRIRFMVALGAPGPLPSAPQFTQEDKT
jgi:signal transduction histidine kinase